MCTGLTLLLILCCRYGNANVWKIFTDLFDYFPLTALVCSLNILFKIWFRYNEERQTCFNMKRTNSCVLPFETAAFICSPDMIFQICFHVLKKMILNILLFKIFTIHNWNVMLSVVHLFWNHVIDNHQSIIFRRCARTRVSKVDKQSHAMQLFQNLWCVILITMI